MVMTNRELDLDVTRTGRKRKQMLTLPPHPIFSSPSLLQKQFRAQLSSRNKLPPDHSSSRRFQFSLQAPSRNLGETGKKIIRAIRITWPQLNGVTSCFFSKEVEYYRFGIGRWLFQFIPPRNIVFYILLPLQRSNFEQKRFLPKKKKKTENRQGIFSPCLQHHGPLHAWKLNNNMLIASCFFQLVPFHY